MTPKKDGALAYFINVILPGSRVGGMHISSFVLSTPVFPFLAGVLFYFEEVLFYVIMLMKMKKHGRLDA